MSPTKALRLFCYLKGGHFAMCVCPLLATSKYFYGFKQSYKYWKLMIHIFVCLFVKHIHSQMRHHWMVLTPLSGIHVFKGKLHLPLEVLPRLLSLIERLEDLRRHLWHLLSPSQQVCLLHVLQFNKQALTILKEIRHRKLHLIPSTFPVSLQVPYWYKTVQHV